MNLNTTICPCLGRQGQQRAILDEEFCIGQCPRPPPPGFTRLRAHAIKGLRR